MEISTTCSSRQMYGIREDDEGSREINNNQKYYENNNNNKQLVQAKFSVKGIKRSDINGVKETKEEGVKLLGLRLGAECDTQGGNIDEKELKEKMNAMTNGNLQNGAKLNHRKEALSFEYDSGSDGGFDTDLESDDEMSENNILQEQKNKYIEVCKRLDVAPATILLNNLGSQSLKLSHIGLGCKGLRAVASTLKSNTCVTNLDLSDNSMGEDGTRVVAKLLRDNLYINNVNLSFNDLSNAGLEELARALKDSSTVKYLKLSKVGLRDRHVSAIADLLRENNSVLILVLSHNEFSVAAGHKLGIAVEANNRVQSLDLSWNHLRNEGAIAFGNGIRNNNMITCLNLAWNGFADSGAEAMGRALQVNTSLVDLDLSYNRITEKGGNWIAGGLKSNCTLQILKLNWNPLKTQGVNSLIEGLKKNGNSALTELQLKGVVVDYNCRSAIEDILSAKPGIKINIGGVTSGGPMFTNVNQLRREIVEIIAAYLAKHRLRMLDLFNQWDKDKSLTLTRNEFRKGIKDCKIPISEMQLNLMLDWLDQDGNDEIEYNEFVSITEVE